MMGMQVWPVAPASYNVAPSSTIDVVRQTDDKRRPTLNSSASNSAQCNNPEPNKLELKSMRWGFSGAGYGTGSQLLFNARSESVFSKPTFRASALNHRAIVPINGFYEWQTTAEGPKRAFYIERPESPAMALAAIFQPHIKDEKKSARQNTLQAQQLSLGFSDNDKESQNVSSKPPLTNTSEIHHSCEHNVCVLTMAANQQMRGLHARMPVIFDPQQAIRWIHEGDEAMLSSCQREAEHNIFAIKQVINHVNNAANDGPECLANWRDKKKID